MSVIRAGFTATPSRNCHGSLMMNASIASRQVHHHYALQGMHLVSERPLAFLYPAHPRTPDVMIRWGEVSQATAPALQTYRRITLHGDGSGILDTRSGLRAKVEAGREVMISAPLDMPAAELHSWIIGPILALLSHQRGRPPLHAGVVVIGGVGVAVAGDSGAGKSTTLAALLARGHRLLTDDEALIDPATLMVEVCAPSMKLAPKAGSTPDPTLRVTRLGRKYHQVLAGGGLGNEPVPLRLIVILERERNAPALRWEKVGKTAAAAELARHVMRPELTLRQGGAAILFRWSTELGRRIPVYRLHRPDDIGLLPDIVSQIEALAALPSL